MWPINVVAVEVVEDEVVVAVVVVVTGEAEETVIAVVTMIDEEDRPIVTEVVVVDIAADREDEMIVTVIIVIAVETVVADAVITMTIVGIDRLPEDTAVEVDPAPALLPAIMIAENGLRPDTTEENGLHPAIATRARLLLEEVVEQKVALVAIALLPVATEALLPVVIDLLAAAVTAAMTITVPMIVEDDEDLVLVAIAVEEVTAVEIAEATVNVDTAVLE